MTARPTLLLFTLGLVVAGCSSTPSQRTSAASQEPQTGQPALTTTISNKPDMRLVKSRDGSFNGEVTGIVARGSKFARLQIGMETSEVEQVFSRVPDRSQNFESGKRWIPFYFGTDARRTQVLYKGEGCLTFTGGNVWGAGGGSLIQIHADPTGKCFQS